MILFIILISWSKSITKSHNQSDYLLQLQHLRIWCDSGSLMRPTLLQRIDKVDTAFFSPNNALSAAKTSCSSNSEDWTRKINGGKWLFWGAITSCPQSITICVDWSPSVHLILYLNQSSSGVSFSISGLPLTHFLSPMQFSPLPRVAASNQRKIAFFTKFAGPQPNITRRTICVGRTNEKGATQSQ